MRKWFDSIRTIQRVYFGWNQTTFAIGGKWRKKKEGDDTETKAVSIRELYSRVVGEGGIAPDYFLDKMDFIEVESFIDGLNRRNREAWEQTRLLGFIIAQSNSTKTLKQTDILRFPWDEEEKKDTSVTDEEMQRFRAKAKEVESQLNTNKDVWYSNRIIA